MFIKAHSSLITLALFYLLHVASARVVWIHEDFNPYADKGNVVRRDSSASCGGVSGLEPCGHDLPANFCCATGTQCLRLNHTAATAVICCPAGQDCTFIRPVTCAMRYQDPSLEPNSALHSTPVQKLDTCGSGCCPAGYSCKANRCWSQSRSDVQAATTTSSTRTSTAQPATTTTTNNAAPPATSTADSSGPSFNGKSFAAGFVPGIAIGAFIAAILLLLLFRKRFGSGDGTYIDEKRYHRDTLTDLGTMEESHQPSTHGRSISEPTIDPSSGGRTDFLRSTPPRVNNDATSTPNGYSVNVVAPSPNQFDPAARLQVPFSHSPFISPTPSTPEPSKVPAHPKRSTPSFKVSPVRALRKQRSMHSLRRQLTGASCTANPSLSRDSSRRTQLSGSRSSSTETIQVLMPSTTSYTPDRSFHDPSQSPEMNEPSYDLPDSATTWETDHSAGNAVCTPDERVPHQAKIARRVDVAQETPTRAPFARTTSRNQLGSPYTPSNAKAKTPGSSTKTTPLPPLPAEVQPSPSLKPPATGTRRDTTFSALMERAGLRKEDFLVGSGPGTEKGKGRRQGG